jgi:hypothetical protein
MNVREFLGTGWAFPVRVDPTGRIAMSSGEQDVQEAIWVILSTSLGERQMRGRFGAGIHDVVFLPNQPLTHGMVAQRVREALTHWESRIDVADVRVEPDADDANRLLIRIDYRLRATNGFGNLVFPYYLTEGRGA